jgi:hypothetical protein
MVSEGRAVGRRKGGRTWGRWGLRLRQGKLV